MNKNIYALFDKQTNTFQNPLHFVNHGDAIRWLTTIVNPQSNQQPTVVSLYPHQFVLCHVANMDDGSGKFESVQEEIMQASEVKEHVQKYTIEDLFEKFQEFQNQKLN